MVSNSSLMRRRRSTIILFVRALSLGNKCPWSLTMYVTIAPPTKPNTNAQRTSCLFMTFPFYQSRACSNHFDPPRLPEWGIWVVSGKSLGIGNRLSKLGDESNGNILLSCEPLVLPQGPGLSDLLTVARGCEAQAGKTWRHESNRGSGQVPHPYAPVTTREKYTAAMRTELVAATNYTCTAITLSTMGANTGSFRRRTRT